ncbi:1,5-anhydro-D-fructose reductase (1,5-anhydro-D-mannitol-forming) [Dysgonomonas sp. PFB1-18]|uniref:Gfo/Idh/MocA family protein n=1 Tax=unclassified Dysgonomonas TaxID=2630389 RepID=UPI002475C9F2|nr:MULTISPECIES: Gfo/Idh/MocA family oxidoreductase [unclassified Dysgonomonas]MDH6307974.1 1,5-anhydro-D-fructose reductase (1,5-anhydro-D-mannitol-forming) [Dysgonomonas sp. PF1-14]MDH6339513.1 1,5-anhydro-D-fructose reductase (1,5-anhydro-D-mannitol-forming) [Dysgonomonas sp. PF1-16]MDH6381164.1 1,5-anhydro-D-fructose reductase (1,5-anhydro-D-mannitol-forming) [Dysgonomonas sp. PFB1-18]MDH6398376.1 1,5-anhydro-D-fructose reductase (1,5-anhydro-D-mannitol-forming) [Dysgonomonas sp. PF1-23]
METVRWGIIGVGSVCEKKSGPAFYKIEHSELVAVMRRDESKVKDYASRHQVKKYYTDADALINDPEVDAIYIATPPSSHKEYAIKALQAGKPVYVEKPMAMDYAECLDMIAASDKAGQKLFVAYYRRALPYFLKVKELLDSNVLGKILTVDIKYIRPAGEDDKSPETQAWRVKKDIAGDGYFFDLAPHTLDILDFLLGEIEDANGYARNLGGYYEVSDTIAATMQFKSGVLGTGLWNFVSPEKTRQDTITITGMNGCIKFNTFSFQPIAITIGDDITYYETEQPEHIQQPLIRTIVNELRGIGTCPSTGVSGARTSRIMDLITDKK